MSKLNRKGSRFAVIDLGSNTFHLLIVERKPIDLTFTEIFRRRDFVYLSAGGMDKISNDASARAVISLQTFRKQIDVHGVKHVQCLGTAMLRSAVNGQAFVDRIKSDFDFEIEIISGQREAELIYKGCLLCPRAREGKVLVMDIGGGSVEFIFMNDGEKVQAWSKNIGISHLRNSFKRSDPALPVEVNRIEGFIETELEEISEAIDRFSPTLLMGASGPFEILERVLQVKTSHLGNSISRKDALSIAHQILGLGLEDRRQIHGMLASRADLSWESMCLINKVLQLFPTISEVFVSPFAMKEGVIAEFYNLD